MKKIVLLLIFYIFLFQTQTFASLFNEETSIKDIIININNLEEEKKTIEKRSKEILKEYGNITSFLKENLTKNDIKKIKENINIFLNKKEEIENKIELNIQKMQDTKELKKELIKNWIDFYKSLVEYIKKEKSKDFVKYVKEKLKNLKIDKDLKEEITIKKNLLTKKVEFLKEKIEENKNKLISDINSQINEKLDQNIKNIEDKFENQKLDENAKKIFYSKMLEQTKINIDKIKNSKIQENFKEIKLQALEQTFELIKNKMQNLNY